MQGLRGDAAAERDREGWREREREGKREIETERDRERVSTSEVRKGASSTLG